VAAVAALCERGTTLQGKSKEEAKGKGVNKVSSKCQEKLIFVDPCIIIQFIKQPT
jgi:hypothetical protein